MTAKTESLICIAGFGGLSPDAPDYADQVDQLHDALFGGGLEGTEYDVDLTDPLSQALAQIPKAECGPVFVALGRMAQVTNEDNVTLAIFAEYRETMRWAESIPACKAAAVADGAALDVLIPLLRARCV